MKCKVKAKDIKKALKSINAIFTIDKTDQRACELIVTEKNTSLHIAAAFAGMFVHRTIPVTVLRPGRIFCNMKDIESLPLKGNVIIDTNDDKMLISCGSSKWSFSVDVSAESSIEAHKEDRKKVKTLAKMPVSLFQAATKTTEFRTQTGDQITQITIHNGNIEYVSRDYISYGRYILNDDAIQAKTSLTVLIANSVLRLLLKDAGDGSITVGTNKDASLVSFKTKDMYVLCPCTTGNVVNIDDEVIKKCKAGEKTFSFVVSPAEIQKAIAAIMPIYKNEAEVALVARNGNMYMSAVGNNHSVNHKIDASEIDAHTTSPVTFNIEYVNEFVKAAPGGLETRIEVWNGMYLYLIMKTEAGMVDYMVVTQN